jgi:tetratricopeptide (TPR) repeat protein
MRLHVNLAFGVWRLAFGNSHSHFADRDRSPVAAVHGGLWRQQVFCGISKPSPVLRAETSRGPSHNVNCWFGKARQAWPNSNPSLGLSLRNAWFFPGLLALLLVGLTGCAHHRESSLQRSEAARALFERTTKEFHLPSAEAQGAGRLKLQEEAAAGYRELIKEYPDQRQWAAQALRSLGNIRAAQTNLNQAVKYYQSVGQRYPDQEWEVLMAWKTAADLLWDAGRQPEAASFYQKIVARFDVPEAPQVIQTVVRGSKRRLAAVAK